MQIRQLSWLLLVVSCARPSPTVSLRPVATAAAQEVLAAERAFAADVRAIGGTLAFRKYVADDAVAYTLDSVTRRPVRVSAKQRLNEQPVRPPAPPGQGLRWWPTFAGASASGDLGYATGPFVASPTRRGFTFSVWRRQADGGWKWIFDGGPLTIEMPRDDSTAIVAFLPAAAVSGGSLQRATLEVAAIEAQLERAASSDGPQALRQFLAVDARVMGSGAQPALTPATHEQELRRWGTALVFDRIGLESSRAGDLVFTHGVVELRRENGTVHGTHMRMWQRRSSGWVLVLAQVLLPSA